jgi:phage recombination protein Bet
MPSTELTRPVGSLALDPTQLHWTDVQRAALAQLKLQDAPEADLAVFLHHCQRTGLDPFAKQVYMIGRWDSKESRNVYTIQTGIDGFRSIAESHPQYAGQLGPQWCGPDGAWTDVWLKQGPPAAAKVGVIRRDRGEPTWAVAHFSEYAVYAGSGNTRSLNSMWRTKGAHMIAKCAEALALRKAFPKTLSGLYAPEEVEHEEPQRHESERTDTPEGAAGSPAAEETIDWDAKLAEAAGDVKALQDLYKLAFGLERNNLPLLERISKAGKDAKDAATAPVDAEVVDEPAASAERPATDKQLTAIAAALGEHGVKERDDRLAVVSFLIGLRVESTRVLTVSEAASVLDTIATQADAGTVADMIRDAKVAWVEASAGEADDSKTAAA